VPDHLVPLTARGKAQAAEAGRAIKGIVGGDPVLYFVSPYERTRGTFREIRAAMAGNEVLQVREESRLREQDFGNFQERYEHEGAEAKRDLYGKFFYRIPDGESGADVMDRVSSFLDTMYRTFRRDWFNPDATIIIVTHGLTLRLFLMRYFHWSVELFERTRNPDNAAFVVMERVGGLYEGVAKYKLTAESAAVVGLREDYATQADAAEAAARAALGRLDIHVPAIASSAELPLAPDVTPRLESAGRGGPPPAGGRACRRCPPPRRCYGRCCCACAFRHRRWLH